MGEIIKRPVFRDKNGNLAVRTPLPTALPEVGITLKSGNATYRFTGRYDGKTSLPAKLLKSMERDAGQAHD